MEQALLVAHIRLCFHQRRWDMLPDSIAALGTACSWSEVDGFNPGPSSGSDPGWSINMALHFLLFRCLWEDRIGHPLLVRRLRKQAFNLMDEAADRQLFADSRAMGGLHEVRFCAQDLSVR